MAIKAPDAVREKVNIHVEPDIYLKPEVKAVEPVCHYQNGYDKYQLPAEQTA